MPRQKCSFLSLEFVNTWEKRENITHRGEFDMRVLLEGSTYRLMDGEKVIASGRNLDCLKENAVRAVAGNPDKIAKVNKAISEYRNH